MAPKTNDRRIKFSDNERVLCYQGPLIYEAKCLKSEIKDNGKIEYLIHYNGWNKHWDEWVSENRVLKFNEINLQKQKLLHQQRNNKDKGKRNKSTSKSVKLEKEFPIFEKKNPMQEVSQINITGTLQELELVPVVVEVKKNKSVVEEISVVEPVSDLLLNCANIQIPAELQPLLSDDWDLITRQKQLYSLPAKCTVEDILLKYTEEKGDTSDLRFPVRRIVSGMQEYFNVMLGSQLLYKFERPQYGDIIETYSNRTVSQIYGPYHLLRFFVRLGCVVSMPINMDLASYNLVLYYASDCLAFLCKHKRDYFHANHYEIAPAEYHRKAIT